MLFFSGHGALRLAVCVFFAIFAVGSCLVQGLQTQVKQKDMKILVTGGAGFIGTHTLIELYRAGHTAVVVDNLSNSCHEALRRTAEIIGVDGIPFYECDICDRIRLELLFCDHQFDACIHFAGKKAVGESVEMPWEYYDNNIGGTLTLVDVMRRHGCRNIIFSSSATVYGEPAEMPITEACPKGVCTNPYGWTKSMIEQILADMQRADPQWNVVLLRYFNPVGAHPSGRIGEDPNGTPNNLMPYITQVAVGKRAELGVFGDDYPTPDGTGVRAYIHVVDLARLRPGGLQPRHRAWLFGARHGEGFRARERRARALRHQATARRRRGHLLLRPLEGAARTWLAGTPRHRRHGARQLELAAAEPRRLRGRLRKNMCWPVKNVWRRRCNFAASNQQL